ncbi:DUF485 domain-containing protein [Kitasatospora sp. NPDC052868]|uniref:DUF485 domain-containing protein n=1 Tax=Kitasatospora sp. NPDC052868 TaxID=3364060 RepID=UPI0037C83E2D
MPQQQTSSPEQGQRFDWWAAAPATTPEPGRPAAAPAAPVQPAPVQPAAAPPPVASAPAAPPPVVPMPAVSVSAYPVSAHPVSAHPVPVQPAPAGPGRAGSHSTEVYRSVQASDSFQEIRRGYRSFVFPVSGAFLGWYLMYVAAQACAPGLMRSQIAGPVNVAWLLGLLQFASTFLLTWLYARNARTKRDRAALDLRWDTQDQLR